MAGHLDILTFSGDLYPSDDLTPPINHICVEYHYTKSVSHIAECTYAQAPQGRSPIDHRSLKNHYTK